MTFVLLIMVAVFSVQCVPTTGQTCTTVSFPRDPCVFPFIFNSKIHYACTTAGDSPTPWCATRVIPATDEVDETQERGQFKYLRDCDLSVCQVEGDTDVVTPSRPVLGCKEVNVNYGGNDIRGSSPTTQLSWELCKKHCQENRRCEAWTFRNQDGFCWIKTRAARRTRENGLVSGPRDCNGQNPSICSLGDPCISDDFGCQFGKCIPKTDPEYSCSLSSPCYEGAGCQFGKCIPKTSPEYSCSFSDPCAPGANCEFGKCVGPQTRPPVRPTRPTVRPTRPPVRPTRPPVRPPVIDPIRPTRPRPCTFKSDCSGAGEKADCQQKQCVTPSDLNFECTFQSDCYDGAKVQCQDKKCRDPSMASFKCTFQSDCFNGDDCESGKCVAGRFGR